MNSRESDGADGVTWVVRAPSHRFDIALEADLVEHLEPRLAHPLAEFGGRRRQGGPNMAKLFSTHPSTDDTVKAPTPPVSLAAISPPSSPPRILRDLA